MGAMSAQIIQSKRVAKLAAAAVTVLLLSTAWGACAAAPSGSPAPDPTPPVRAAMDDAARNTGVAVDELKATSVERVTWPDGSLGCPEPDMMYTQALVPGYRIHITAGGKLLDYHADTHGQLLLCPPERARAPSPAPAAAPAAHDHSQHLAAMAGETHYLRELHSYTIPDVVLTDADGRPVRLRELLGSDDPVMLNFIFTTCTTICPVMSKVFSDLPPRMGTAAANLRLVSISIDPENDTPAQLKSYAGKFRANPRWLLLTGRLEDIKAVQVAFDSYRGDKMAHEPLTLMRHTGSQSWVRISGFATPDELVREYRRPETP
jgi:protein SCO1/2